MNKLEAFSTGICNHIGKREEKFHIGYGVVSYSIGDVDISLISILIFCAGAEADIHGCGLIQVRNVFESVGQKSGLSNSVAKSHRIYDYCHEFVGRNFRFLHNVSYRFHAVYRIFASRGEIYRCKFIGTSLAIQFDRFLFRQLRLHSSPCHPAGANSEQSTDQTASYRPKEADPFRRYLGYRGHSTEGRRPAKNSPANEQNNRVPVIPFAHLMTVPALAQVVEGAS